MMYEWLRSIVATAPSSTKSSRSVEGLNTSTVGYLVHETSPSINKHGGQLLFKPELRSRGWVEFTCYSESRCWREPKLAPTESFGAPVALLALAVALLPGRRAKRRRWRCALALFFVLLLLALTWVRLGSWVSLQPRWPADGQALVDVLIVLVSSGAAGWTSRSLGVGRSWRSALGPRWSGCVLVNHAAGEYEAFDKDAVIRQLRSWYARRGCAAPPIVPPTFFLREPGDCAALLAHTTTAEGARGDNETTLWYLKDPSGGSHGKGVRVFTGDGLREHLRVGASAAEAAAACAPGGWLVRRGGALQVQRGIAPLLLAGGRKFDVRVGLLVESALPPYFDDTARRVPSI